ncbi:MAG: hypothetical protein OEZ48_13165 [Candidatus Bathyarchaeota archaeon]|nr:hypothetical protein [Candidatus Bathyarchaeota archaeon]MDH5688796.1 hypothetical protein [Candidatus Bathyarchaeota archaeon]
MATRRKSRLTLLALLLSTLLIATASAAIFYQITAGMSFKVGWSPVVFTDGEDSEECGATVPFQNNASVSFTSVPLTIASNVTITQLVNVTNSDTSDHNVTVDVSSHNFDANLTILLLYLVSPSGSQTLVVKLGDSGSLVTDDIQVEIPAGEEWAVKLIGCYDDTTLESKTNTMTLTIRVED